MKTILLALLIFPACNVYEPPGEAAPFNAPAECAWVDETYACDPELLTRELEPLDDGDTYCTIYTYHCGAVVDACKRQVYDCQPQGEARRGGP